MQEEEEKQDLIAVLGCTQDPRGDTAFFVVAEAIPLPRSSVFITVMIRFSSGSRCLCLVLAFSLAACLLTVHLYSAISQETARVGKIQMGGNLHSQYWELKEVEELQIPRSSSIKASLTTSLVDEFLDKSSKIRPFFFPDKRHAVDPRKRNNIESSHYYPGRIWLDTDGNSIQAHGGGILHDERSRMYYWYGEYKDGPTYRSPGKGVARVDVIGVGCYSSRDLRTWKNEGLVLKAEERNQGHDLHKSNVLERPKVIYNEKTRKYVMWMHIDNGNYTKAAVGIATGDSPIGPFEYLHSKSPHGFDSRDMTIFKDDDGTAYVVYSSLHNRELHIGPLRQDYRDVTNVMTKVLVGQHREAPAVFKHRGKYYMITSGCSGWAPNEALAHVADSMLGPWETIGNPCVGANKVFRVTTFFAQSTFVLPMPGGAPGSFLFLADRWNPDDLQDSRYVWLPLIVDDEAYQLSPSNTRPQVAIFWHAKWKMPQRWSDTK